MLWGKSVIRPPSVNGDAFTKESSERAFSYALWFEVVMAEGWAVSPQSHLAALVVWRVVEHRPAQVSKCCWSPSAMSPGVVSCQTHGRCWKVGSLQLPKRPHKPLVSCHHAALQPWLVSSQASCQGCPWGQRRQQFCLLHGWVGAWGGGDPWFMCWGRLQWVSQSLLTRAGVPVRDLLKPAKALLLPPQSSCLFPLNSKSFPDQEWGNSHSPS